MKLATSKASVGIRRNWLGSKSQGSLHAGQFMRIRRNPRTPVMLDANRKGSISMLIKRANTPAVLPL